MSEFVNIRMRRDEYEIFRKRVKEVGEIVDVDRGYIKYKLKPLIFDRLIRAYGCPYCGHIWTPRIDKPSMCPKCKREFEEY